MMSSTTFNGTVAVTIADAQINLSQLGSKQDPYCVVTLGSSGIKRFMEGETLGKEKFETKVHNNAGQHPIWNETHSMSLKNMTTDSHLKIKVYDKDIGRDDSMGIAKINLSQLLTNDKKGVQYYPIYKKSKLGQPKSGQIGQIGVGVVFNCTDLPQWNGDVKTQHGMTSGVTSGVTGAHYSTQPSYQPSYTQQPLGHTTTFPQQTGTFPQQTGTFQQTGTMGTVPQQTGTLGGIMGAISGIVNSGSHKPVATQSTIPQTQGQVYGQVPQTQGQVYGQVPQTQLHGQQYGQQYGQHTQGHYY